MTDAPDPERDNCPSCRGTGVVINGDGRPGWRHPRICFHTRGWRVMNELELQRHHKRLERLNANPTPELSARRPNPAAVSNADASGPPRRVASERGPGQPLTTPHRRDIDD